MDIDLGIREVRQVTGFLKNKYGMEYSDYALTSFKRRLDAFLTSKRYGVDTLIKNLESEVFLDHFIAGISVGDTELFRDPTFWILLKNNYIANIIDEHPKTRIWLPACATGEEYYSLEILLKESGWTDRVEIYLSSMSNEKLEYIKNGNMELEKLEVSTKNYSRFQGTKQFSDYFKILGNNVVFDKSLFINTKFFKEGLDFSHDIPYIHLILFRNKMIYFNPSLQYKVSDILYGKLAAKGLLALGILEEVEGKFNVLNRNESVYQRRG